MGCEGCFVRPRWTTDPDIERIREVVEREIPSVCQWQQEVTITFFAKGAFNKVYTVCIGGKELIMRVTLPVDPQRKTLSEVATVQWVRRNTHLPVPEIFAYEASRDNPIGFEWILMSKLPGRPLLDAWKSMGFAAKKQLTHEVAVFCSSMFKKQLRGIGNLYPDTKLGEFDDSDPPEVQRIVSFPFFWGNHVMHPVPRGPFRSSRDWLEARLLCCEHDFHSIIASCKTKKQDLDPYKDDEGGVLKSYDMLDVIARLKLLLDDLFPSSKFGCAEPSILCHDDLAKRNMLVDEAGVLTGVVDWECVSALPLWKACNYPDFLVEGLFPWERPLDKEAPIREHYEHESDFWEHMMHYETTILREYFLEDMQRLEPGWVKEFKDGELQRGFDLAVRNCSDYIRRPKSIRAWIDGVLRGRKMPSSSGTTHNNTLHSNAAEVFNLVNGFSSKNNRKKKKTNKNKK